tara:strand:- start:56 stop:1585 length:1530 start_codon:yes stop_codon:yes gene_type:complete
MGSLQNKTISETYPCLLHIVNDSDDAQALDGTLRVIEDGVGTDSILSLSTTQATIGGVNFVGSTTVVDLDVREDFTASGSTFKVDHTLSRVGINTSSALKYDLDVTGNIGFTGDIIHSGDDNTYISPGADEWEVYTGGTKRFEIDNDAVTTMDVNFIAQSDSTVSPYPLFTSESNGFVGIGNNQAPVNLLHLKVLGANVDDGHKGGEDPDPENAEWMRNTFISIENTFTSDGTTGESDDYMFNVSTGIKTRQKVYGSTDVITTGMIEFAPRQASVTSARGTHNSKMDIWLNSSAPSYRMWRRMLGLKAYGYDIIDVSDGSTVAYNNESVLCVGPDLNAQYGGYISTLGAREDEDTFRHPMHYTDIDTDDTDGSDMGIQDKNFCESLNLIKSHVWRGVAGTTTVKNGYAAGICFQPKYDLIFPADDLTITNHNYISVTKAVQGSPSSMAITNTNLLNFDFDPDFDGDAETEGHCIRPAEAIGALKGSIYITIGSNASTQTQYLIPFYAVP